MLTSYLNHSVPRIALVSALFGAYFAHTNFVQKDIKQLVTAAAEKIVGHHPTLPTATIDGKNYTCRVTDSVAVCTPQ